MATNKPTGDNAPKGAVRKRAQLRTEVMGESTWTKRDKSTGGGGGGGERKKKKRKKENGLIGSATKGIAGPANGRRAWK